MKKKTAKKLTLSKETLVRLDAADRREAAGRGWSDESVCPTLPSRFCA